MHRYRTIILQPHWLQFVIDELPEIILTTALYFVAGLESIPMPGIIFSIAGVLTIGLIYRFIYLRRIECRINGEQLIMEYGVFTRKSDYLELYRIVDFNENRTIMQQIFGLKTVTIFSGDRNTPKLDIIGVKNDFDLVSVLRERVAFCKKTTGVYEITNRY
nr:PH domain-containing protein [Bacteroides sp. HPS0048]